MRLEESIELVAGRKAQHPAHGRPYKPSALVLFQCERFQRPARQIATSRSQVARKFVRNLKSEVNATL